MKLMISIIIIFSSCVYAQDQVLNPVPSNESQVEQKTENKKDNVLDFSAGVIEGDLNRPSMLMELGSNYKEFNDLVLLREDFNSFHDNDSKIRFRYVDENL